MIAEMTAERGPRMTALQIRDILPEEAKAALRRFRNAKDPYQRYAVAFTDWLTKEGGIPGLNLMELPSLLMDFFQFKAEENGGRPLGAAGMNNYLTMLRARFKEELRRPYIKGHPVLQGYLQGILERDLKPIKITETSWRAQALTEEEVDMLLTSPRVPIRIKRVIEFLFWSGCRISEAIELRLTQLKRVDGFYHWETVGKGGQARECSVPAEVIERIRRTFGGKTYLLETTTGGQYSRQYLSWQVRLAGERALPRDADGNPRIISAHVLRHTHGTLLYDKTKDLVLVQKRLGHRRADTTLRYVHSGPTHEDIRKLGEKLKGVGS